MKIYICEICGEAHIGKSAPVDCPFCGAPANFLKEPGQADVLINKKVELSETSRKNLEYSLKLEVHATAIYECMSGKAKDYEIKIMFKRLSRVEAEHISVFAKLLGVPRPEVKPESCSDDDMENFKQTLLLEENATSEYMKFAKEAPEKDIKLIFAAIGQAERGHVELMKNYLG